MNDKTNVSRYADKNHLNPCPYCGFSVLNLKLTDSGNYLFCENCGSHSPPAMKISDVHQLHNKREGITVPERLITQVLAMLIFHRDRSPQGVKFGSLLMGELSMFFNPEGDDLAHWIGEITKGEPEPQEPGDVIEDWEDVSPDIRMVFDAVMIEVQRQQLAGIPQNHDLPSFLLWLHGLTSGTLGTFEDPPDTMSTVLSIAGMAVQAIFKYGIVFPLPMNEETPGAEP